MGSCHFCTFTTAFLVVFVLYLICFIGFPLFVDVWGMTENAGGVAVQCADACLGYVGLGKNLLRDELFPGIRST